MFTCILVDDEPLARKVLCDYLARFDDWRLVRQCSEAVNLDSLLASEPVDLLFLDIKMPGMSGVEFLSSSSNAPLTIFTTAYPDYAVEAFALESFDYLLKPISFERFHRSLTRASKLLVDTSLVPSWLSIKEGKRLYRIGINEIQSLQAYGDYVRIYTEHKTYLTKSKLSSFVKGLPQSVCQCHRSWYVNIDHVNYFEGGHLSVGSHLIPVSSTYREEILDRLHR